MSPALFEALTMIIIQMVATYRAVKSENPDLRVSDSLNRQMRAEMILFADQFEEDILEELERRRQG
ncbi:MAG: hypothetical protein ACR2RE_12685 [Geminicoccaceae bacterium]